MPVVEEKPAANLFVACTVPSAATVIRTVALVLLIWLSLWLLNWQLYKPLPGAPNALIYNFLCHIAFTL